MSGVFWGAIVLIILGVFFSIFSIIVLLVAKARHG